MSVCNSLINSSYRSLIVHLIVYMDNKRSYKKFNFLDSNAHTEKLRNINILIEFIYISVHQ